VGKLNLFFVQKKAKETFNKKIENTRSSLANPIFPLYLIWLSIFIYLYKSRDPDQSYFVLTASTCDTSRFYYLDLKVIFEGLNFFKHLVMPKTWRIHFFLIINRGIRKLKFIGWNEFGRMGKPKPVKK
jgi:hypothetical protein